MATFPSPQVGSGQVSSGVELRFQECFHPLKSGRDHYSGGYKNRKGLFPSPQVGSGRAATSLFPLFLSEFPSPQVGSGPSAPSINPPVPLCFHPLKSGRDVMHRSGAAVVVPGFHPLKSGRDVISSARTSSNAFVSIPSSRVGTAGGYHRNAPLRGFHPLKSGRDRSSKAGVVAKFEKFPSPQVGSGPRQKGGFVPHFG